MSNKKLDMSEMFNIDRAAYVSSVKKITRTDITGNYNYKMIRKEGDRIIDRGNSFEYNKICTKCGQKGALPTEDICMSCKLGWLDCKQCHSRSVTVDNDGKQFCVLCFLNRKKDNSQDI